MRLWSIHPKYLDSIGLIALWRESLLAKKVLEGNTKGYTNHPQLIRFKNMGQGKLVYVNNYLLTIYNESIVRGFIFNKDKIDLLDANIALENMYVTNGQLEYEFSWLLEKLQKRSVEKYHENLEVENIEPNPIFSIIKGPVEEWEKLLS